MGEYGGEKIHLSLNENFELWRRLYLFVCANKDCGVKPGRFFFFSPFFLIFVDCNILGNKFVKSFFQGNNYLLIE